MSETLARLGANVTGIDPTLDLIKIAKHHASLDSTLTNLNYLCASIEEHSVKNENQYDSVVASEVIEHITEKEVFVHNCVKCLKPGGSIFFTTLNNTVWTNIFGIWAAEYLLSLVPKGTHSLDKCISPHQLQRILEESMFENLRYT